MMGEKSLLREGLVHILYEIFENYSEKKIYVLLEKDGYNDLKDIIIKFVDDNTPGFIRNKLNIKELQEDSKIAILGQGAIYKIEFELVCNWSADRYSKETSEVVDYILKLSDLNRAELFKKSEQEVCQSVLDLHKLCMSTTFEEKDNSETTNINEENAETVEKVKENCLGKWIEKLMTLKSEKELEKEIKDINDKIDDYMLNDYLKQILSNPENIAVDYFSPKKDLYKLILFEDLLSVDYKDLFTKELSFDVDYIADWFKNNIVPVYKNNYGENWENELKIEVKNYDVLDFRGQNFENIKSAIYKVVKNIEVEKVEEVKKSTEEEKDVLKKNVESINLETVDDIFDLADKFKDLEVKYKENKSVLADKYSERLIEILDDEKCEDIPIKTLNEFVNTNKQYFNEKVYIYMQVYIQKSLEKIKDNLEKDLEAVNDIEALEKAYDEVLANGEFVVCRDIEEIVMQKLEDIIKKLNLADINDEDNINRGIRICDKTQVVNLDDYEIASILVDREFNIDLNNINDTIDELLCIDEFINEVAVKNCMFNYNYYNLEMNVNGGEDFYTVKYKYIKELVDYIKLKNKRFFLVKLKSLSTKVRHKNRVFKKGNIELVEALDSFYNNK